MDGLDGGRVGDQEPRRPEPIGQVEAARLELGRQPAVEDDRPHVQIMPDAVRCATIVMSSAGADARPRTSATVTVDRVDDVLRPYPPRARSIVVSRPALAEPVRPTGRARRSPRPCSSTQAVAGRQPDVRCSARSSDRERAEEHAAARRWRRSAQPSAGTSSGGSWPALATAAAPCVTSRRPHSAVMNSDVRRSSTRIRFVRSRAIGRPRRVRRWQRGSAGERRP